MWRTEARFFSADDEIFPDDDGTLSETSTVLVTSLSIPLRL